MKKIIQYTLFGLALLSLLVLSSCTRTNIDDPGMDNNDSYFINLSGVANPSTLFIPSPGEDSSTIHMRAHFNTGEPVVGREILLLLEDDIGYFPNNKRNITLVTNSDGRATTVYKVKHFAIDLIGASKLIYIHAYINSDLHPVNEDFHEHIPVLLLTMHTDVDTLAAIPTELFFEWDQESGQELLVYNSSGGSENPIAFVYTIVEAGVSWVHVAGFEGFTTNTLDITCDENDTGLTRTATIRLTATDPAVLNSPLDITVTQDPE